MMACLDNIVLTFEFVICTKPLFFGNKYKKNLKSANLLLILLAVWKVLIKFANKKEP